MNDNQFATTMMIVLGALVAFTVLILVLANFLMPSVDYSEDSLVQSKIEERIKPIGELSIAGVTPANATGSDDSGATTVADAGTAKTPEQLYTACAACHDAGVLNAPKLGDKAGWEPRLAKGIDALYAGAINGIGAMPAKGGRADLSDEEIKIAVDYMLESVK